MLRAALVPVSLYAMFVGAMQVLNPAYLLPETLVYPADPLAASNMPLVGSFLGAAIFLLASFASSITLSAARIEFAPKRIRTRRGHTPFGWVIQLIAGNPVMPVVTIAAVFSAVFYIAFVLFPQNSRGVDFFVETEPEQATVYVRARGNLSLAEKDRMVRQAERVVAAHPAVINVFSFAGDGGLRTNTNGGRAPADTIGQVQFEIIPWEQRPKVREPWLGGRFEREVTAPEYDGDTVLEQLQNKLDELPGFVTEVKALERGPASGKPVHLRLKGDDWDDLRRAVDIARAKMAQTPGLIQIEDTLPLPGIDWQIDVDVAKAGRYGADVATVGAMVQLVTRGILLDTMRVDTSEEEIEIRARLPQKDRVLSTLDSLKVRTADGLVPLSNFITRQPVPKRATISRVDQRRYYDVKADVAPGLARIVRSGADGKPETLATVHLLQDGETTTDPILVHPSGDEYRLMRLDAARSVDDLRQALDRGEAHFVPINANERIALLTDWLETRPLPASVTWEWTGDREEQAESQAFLSKAFLGALGLMFVILLAQFNSFYHAVLVLLAVVLSTTGVLIGMMVMEQPFSIIMTGTGIVALAGIVVNNNIVLIDTYQEFSAYMPRIEAIVRTAEARIRPVLLTTITTMAGLTPMMFGISLDFWAGGYSIDSPTALWWKQLATAVVFGLGIATVLTLVVTPSFLALPVWITTYARWFGQVLARITGGRAGRAARDMALRREMRQLRHPEIIWDDLPATRSADAGAAPAETPPPDKPLRAAE